jgi:predicted amidohydrolase YtcJ
VTNHLPSTLLRGGRVYSPAEPRATALLVADGQLRWVGHDADAPSADRVVELAGALVTPAFVDAHVHCTGTGLTLGGLDLAGVGSAAGLLDAVAGHAATLPADATVIGHGWDESGWPQQTPPDAAQLDRAGGGRPVYLAQASVHSALVSSTLLAVVTPAPGFDPSGWLRREAHHRARAVALGSISTAQRRRAQLATLRRAASLGIVAVHECGGPEISDERDFTGLLELGAGAGVPEVYGYWGELGAAAKARELGAVGAGGDLFADGALGSQTAHLRESYRDADSCGHGYLSVEQVAAHLVECVRVGVQGGFHAIGDAAIGTVLTGFAEAARRVGLERVRAARHRIEHAEILDRALIRGFVEYGIVASVQPAFDRLWGGDGRMYAQRLGVPRSLAANPFGSLAGVGATLAFGSDSPVTPLDPWGTVRAAVQHHNPTERLAVRAAFAAHTRGGWRAVHRDADGVLVPGGPANLAVWDAPGDLVGGLPTLLGAGPDEPAPPLPQCRMTLRRGDVIFERDG